MATAVQGAEATNPHKTDECNECGKKKEAGESFYAWPIDTVHAVQTANGTTLIAHERAVCKTCYGKAFEQLNPGQKSPV
jgi:hypothetical protein